MTSQETATVAQFVRDIDDRVAGIYARFSRFSPEYELREAQAQSFKDAGYAGGMPQQVAAFANRAGMAAQPATSLILSQASAMRAGLAVLGDLRMRKYEVMAAASFNDAQAAYTSIDAAITAANQGLP